MKTDRLSKSGNKRTGEKETERKVNMWVKVKTTSRIKRMDEVKNN